MTTVLLAIAFIGVFFILMSVRLIFLKNGEFKGTCASQSPFLEKEGITCNFCGKTVQPGDACAEPNGQNEKNPGSEVNKVLSRL